MSQAKLRTACLEGISAFCLTLEVSVGGGLPMVKVVGLPDAALREARERVKPAIRVCGWSFPQTTVTVNVAPARRRKEEGSACDLPLALAILASMGDGPLKPNLLEGVAALGELALSGETRAVRGALAAAEALAEAGVARLLVSRASAEHAALGARGRMEVIPVDHLTQAVGFLRGELAIAPLVLGDPERLLSAPGPEEPDLAEVRGAEGAKLAAVVAAAGAHDLLPS